MSSTRNWFRLPFVYKPRADRRESPALVAVYWEGHTPLQSPIANLSKSGAYVKTREQWYPGSILALTLQRKGTVAVSNRSRFTVQAKAIRRDENGVGISFLLPKGTDLRLWESTIKSSAPQTEPEDVVREFRTASALAFVSQISPAATERAAWLVRRGLSSHRQENALEVILHAQEILALDPTSRRPSAHPDVVLRIIEDGSWPESDWVQHYWSGLLVSACKEGDAHVPDLEAAELLSQLTIIQARILASACESASKYVDSYGNIRAKRLSRSADELIRISGTHDRAHIERDVQHLSWLGLLEQAVKWKFFALMEEAEVTPTPLGLRLYASCHAHRAELSSFYALEPEMAASISQD